MDCCFDASAESCVGADGATPCGFLAGPKQYFKLTTIVSGPRFDSAVVYADATP